MIVTRSPASSATWVTCRSSLSCEPTRATAASVTTMPEGRVSLMASGRFSSGSRCTSRASTQLKLPFTGRTAQ